MPTVPADKLTALARRVFAAAGSAEDEAALVAEHLVEANLKGHDSHGVGMIPSYLRNLRAGHAAVNQPGRVVSDQGSIIVYDGERGWGQIVARNAILLGIERARRDGVAVVALRNAHHIGRIGTYGEMCAGAGLVSMHFVNITDQRPAVAPWRGRDGRFGTNPVCVALPGPAPERPIIADMATSRIAMGKVRVARNKGQQIAAETLLGPDGEPTTDPECHVPAAARRAADLRRAQGLRAGLYLRDAGRRRDRQRHDAPGAAEGRGRHERHADSRHRPGPAGRSGMDEGRDPGDGGIHYRLAAAPAGRARADPRRPRTRQPRRAAQRRRPDR